MDNEIKYNKTSQTDEIPVYVPDELQFKPTKIPSSKQKKTRKKYDHFIEKFAIAILSSASVLAAIYYGDLPYIIIVAFIGMVIFIEWTKLTRNAKYKTLALILGLLYFSLSLYSLVWIREFKHENNVNFSRAVTLWMIATVLAAELGAYLGNTSNKEMFGSDGLLLPKISMEISWVGVMSSFLFAGSVSVACMMITKNGAIIGAVIGFCLAFLALCGHLLFEFLKKLFNVREIKYKYFSKYGVIDLSAGLMFAAPTIALALYIIKIN